MKFLLLPTSSLALLVAGLSESIVAADARAPFGVGGNAGGNAGGGRRAQGIGYLQRTNRLYREDDVEHRQGRPSIEVIPDALDEDELANLLSSIDMESPGRSLVNVEPQVISKLRGLAGMLPVADRRMVQVKVFNETTTPHVDSFYYGDHHHDVAAPFVAMSYNEPDHRVAYVWLNDNPDGYFNHGDVSTMPIKARTLVHFRGDIPHNTVINKVGSKAALLGPFLMKHSDARLVGRLHPNTDCDLASPMELCTTRTESNLGFGGGSSACNPDTDFEIYASVVGDGGMITAEVCGTSGQEVLVNVETDCFGTPTCLVQGTGGPCSSVTFQSTAGTTYFIEYGGFDGDDGEMLLVVTSTVSCAEPTAPPVLPELPAFSWELLATISTGFVAALALLYFCSN